MYHRVGGETHPNSYSHNQTARTLKHWESWVFSLGDDDSSEQKHITSPGGLYGWSSSLWEVKARKTEDPMQLWIPIYISCFHHLCHSCLLLARLCPVSIKREHPCSISPKNEAFSPPSKLGCPSPVPSALPGTSNHKVFEEFCRNISPHLQGSQPLIQKTLKFITHSSIILPLFQKMLLRLNSFTLFPVVFLPWVIPFLLSYHFHNEEIMRLY